MIVIVALAFLSGAIVLPPLPGTSVQTLSQTVATQETSWTLQVQINIAKNPVAPESTQAVTVTVHDPGGSAVSGASVRVEVLYPSRQNVVFEGSTDANGQYSYSWPIPTSGVAVGVCQVTASATKAGYNSGQGRATFVIAV